MGERAHGMLTPIFIKDREDMEWPTDVPVFYILSRTGLFLCRQGEMVRSCVRVSSARIAPTSTFDLRTRISACKSSIPVRISARSEFPSDRTSSRTSGGVLSLNSWRHKTSPPFASHRTTQEPDALNSKVSEARAASRGFLKTGRTQRSNRSSETPGVEAEAKTR